MPDASVSRLSDRRGPARHERPTIDDAALVAARHADRILTAARERGLTRWERFFERIPDRLRDDELRDLRSTALRARAAYGPKDSVRDAISPELTEPFLDALDRLVREMNRRDAGRSD